MLIEDKFIFLNIPRCASTSFHISCINSGFDVKYYTNDEIFRKVKKFDENDHIHTHESINELEAKFGDKYPIISIRRQKYERFFSMWKHVIGEALRYGDKKSANVFTKLKVNDILYYDSDDVIDSKNRHNFIMKFLLKNGLSVVEVDQRILTMLNVLITPTSHYHNNRSDIIWFNFQDLNNLEKWVQELVGKPFNLQNVNSSKNIDCAIKINEDLIREYDRIYSVFDNHKETKSII
jgi:hypothetical protein